MTSLITDHIDIWSAAQTAKTNGRGKSAGNQSPHGIKKLRELILELAVRGKLVPQDPNDEPASVLLEKIAKERKRLLKEGKIKKQESLPEISEDENPFELLQGWEFVRLGDVANRIGSGSTPRGGKSVYNESGIPFLRSQNIWNYGLELRDVAYIAEDTHQEMSNTVVLPNDILLNITGASLGRCTIYPDDLGEANVSQHVTIIRPTDPATRYYLHICILSPYTQKLVWGRQVGMAREGLSKKVLELFEIPFPSLAEQHRIVAKVDELMALCDRLEQQQTDSNATHQAMVETLLGTLTNIVNQGEFAESWQRIVNHFDTMFTTEHSIDQLKQTILQLAVMGKLVPQDPKDEPASVLLGKIAKEKKRLIKEGKIKKQELLTEISEDEKPFALPKGWSWVTLSHLGVFSGGKTPSKAKSIYWDGDIPWVTPKDMKVAQILDTEDHVTALAIDDGLALNDPGTILFVVRSGILRRSFPVAITKVACTVNQDLKVLSLYKEKLASYVYLMMRGFEKYILEKLTKTGMTVESVMFEEFSKHYFMLPPLAEQHRIVAKVDELMTLCDALKERLNDAQTTQIQLADSIVEQAVA